MSLTHSNPGIVGLIFNKDCKPINNFGRGTLYEFLYDIDSAGFGDCIRRIDEHVLPMIFKDFCLFEIHTFNCMLRRYEGFFINQSLIQMKATITQYLVYSLSRLYGTTTDRPQVLMYQGLLPHGCASDSFKYQPFSFFNYNTLATKEAIVRNRSEVLFKLFFKTDRVNDVFGCGLDCDTTKLIVFTVINTNDNENVPESIDSVGGDILVGNTKLKISNNPPTPPYINTNILKSFYNESIYMHTITEFFKKVEPGDFSELHEELKQVHKIYSYKYEQLNIVVT